MQRCTHKNVHPMCSLGVWRLFLLHARIWGASELEIRWLSGSSEQGPRLHVAMHHVGILQNTHTVVPPLPPCRQGEYPALSIAVWESASPGLLLFCTSRRSHLTSLSGAFWQEKEKLFPPCTHWVPSAQASQPLFGGPERLIVH